MLFSAMMKIHFIELCGGSAAITMYLNEQEPLLSYAGSKRSYAVDLVRLMKLDRDAKYSFHLNEPGLWYHIHHGLQEAQHDVASAIDCQSESKSVYQAACYNLSKPIPSAVCERSAAAILKLAGTFGNHEVGGFKGCNPKRQKDGFSPNRKTIVSRVNEYKPIFGLTLTQQDASQISPYLKKNARMVCYMDVPYVGKEKSYVNQFNRAQVIKTALAWKAKGSDVYISECTPIEELIKLGWKSSLVKSNTHSNYRVRRNTTTEWLTYYEQ